MFRAAVAKQLDDADEAWGAVPEMEAPDPVVAAMHRQHLVSDEGERAVGG